MIEVRALPGVVSPGDVLTIVVREFDNIATVTDASINLSRVDEDYSGFAFGWGAKPTLKCEELWIASANTTDLQNGIHEIDTITLTLSQSEGSQTGAKIVGGRDFPRTFLDVVPKGEAGRDQNALADAVRDVENAREAEFQKGIDVGQAGDDAQQFRAFAFLTPALLTRRLRIGQLELIPMEGIPGYEHVELLSRFFDMQGSPEGREFIDKLTQDTAAQSPVTVVHFPLIRASSSEDLDSFLRERCAVLNNLLALHRNAHGRVIGLLTENLSTNETSYLVATESYRGNLLGGFISGEDPRSFRSDYLKSVSDPSVRLFVSLYSQALAELNVDFAYLRFWNLLEAMATRYISDLRIRVSDFSGAQLIIGTDSRVTTSRPEGRVYQFVKNHFQQARVSETAFASILPVKNLTMWDLCLIWYDFRNAMAHFGGFDPADSRQRHLSRAAGAYSEITSGSNARTISSDPYLDALKETSKVVLSRQLTLMP